MRTLTEIRTTLRTALASDAVYALVVARLALRCGVGLERVEPARDEEAETVRRVLEGLEALGFHAGSLELVAANKASRR